MRIAVFSHYYLPEIGAPSARVGDMGHQWVEAGHEVHVGSCFPNHPTGKIYPGYRLARYKHEVLNGIHVHRSWTYVTPNRGLLKKTFSHASLWFSSRLFTLPRLPPPDCVIGTSPTFFAAMAARACARRHGAPFIMEVRDLWPAIFVDLGVVKNRQLIWLLEQWEMSLYRSATRIVTVTEAFRRNLVRRGIPADRVVNIPNGADTDVWQPAPAAAAALREELKLGVSFVVLYIGAHGISQGLAAILEAAERLTSEHQISFVFVGEGAERELLIKRAEDRGLRNTRFLDPVDREKARAFYSMADLCLVPLRSIPLFADFIPSKIFEIMAVGRPILASVRGESAEILRRSGAADVVAPEDGAAIAAGIRRLLLDPERRCAMAAAGREFVLREYSRALLAKRYLAVMNEAKLDFRPGT